MLNFLTKKTKKTRTIDDRQRELVEFARTSYVLPADYFSKWTPERFNVHADNFQLCDDMPEVQSPLHRITDCVHPDVEPELRERLWRDEEYRNAIMHIFQKQTAKSLRIGLERMEGNGYWEPARLLLARVLEERLYGATATVQEYVLNHTRRIGVRYVPRTNY